MSRTLREALFTEKTTRFSENFAARAPISTAKAVTPEQYWATRALTAETLLSAKLAHAIELKQYTSEEEMKRIVCFDLLVVTYVLFKSLPARTECITG
jgi:hypothetical protein